jgi:hypothetical protein
MLPFGLKNIRLVTNAFNPNVIARPLSNINAIEKQQCSLKPTSGF